MKIQKKRKTIKSEDFSTKKHIEFLDKLEEMMSSAFDSVMSKAVSEITKVAKKKNLKKSDDLYKGWTGDVPKIEVNFEKIIEDVMSKYLLALKWVMYGDMAGKEAIEAATETGLIDKYVPGIIPSSYLDSIDSSMEHFEDIFGVKSPSIKKEMITESLENIKKRTEKFADESFTKLKNRMTSSSEELLNQIHNENINSVMENARVMMEDGKGSKKAVKESIKEVVENSLTSPKVSRALKEAIENYKKDFDVMVNANVSMASDIGTHQTMVEIFGRKDDDLRIYILAYKDEKTCSFCSNNSRRSDGSFKIYRLSDFEPTGYNYGRKRADWKLTIGSSHPNCRCKIMYLPSGFKVGMDGSLIPE